MLECVRNGLEQRAFSIFVVAAIFGILAGIIAAGGGLAIVVGPISLGVFSSAIVAGLIIFGLVVAIGVLAIVLGCALGARAPSVDEDPPPVSGSGVPSVSQAVTTDGGEKTDGGGKTRPEDKSPPPSKTDPGRRPGKEATELRDADPPRKPTSTG